MRVMIVDDSKEMVRLIEKLVEKHGDTVVKKAHTCKETIELAREVDFDILIIDQRLPDGNGYDTALKIAEMKNIHVAIITSDDDFTCEDFPVLRKPFSREELYNILDSYQK